MTTDYLTVGDVLGIHGDQIAAYGGAHGVRDMGLLESALYRPQTGYYPDLVAEAAALWESLGQNHPFIDGNKRTAFASTYVFLRMNGLRIVAEPQEAYDFIMGLYDKGGFAFIALETWLRAHVRPTMTP